jgi:anti-sigma factor (TIGR02949 family)
MGCDDVKRVIYFFLDGSLADAKRLDITQHLSLCPECEQRSRIQRRLREFVQRRLRPVPAPEHLRIRLSRLLRALILSAY